VTAETGTATQFVLQKPGTSGNGRRHVFTSERLVAPGTTRRGKTPIGIGSGSSSGQKE